MNTETNKLTAPAIVLGMAIVLSSLIGTIAIKALRTGDSITVTGSAKVSVMSDTAKLSGSVNKRTGLDNLSFGYSEVAKNTEQVIAFLKEKGLSEESISTSPASATEVYDYSQYGGSQIVGYEVRQQITVNSDDVDLIKNVSETLPTLSQKGIFFQSYGPEYYYSKLAETRVTLLGEAIKDAKLRALEIAKSSGNTVGTLKSASGGVVQVLTPNSADISDYGRYDTGTIEKEVSITVRAEFAIN